MKTRAAAMAVGISLAFGAVPLLSTGTQADPAETPAAAGASNSQPVENGAGPATPSSPTPLAATSATPATAMSPAASSTPDATLAAAPVLDPVVDSIRRKLSDKSYVGKFDASDVTALSGFYSSRTEPLWIKDGTINDRGKALASELRKADDWGLEAAAFNVPELAADKLPEARADADIGLSLGAMKYARYARGGRIDPVALSNILDMKPPLKDSKDVLTELAASSEPDAYLRSMHPKHPQFEALRQALLKARGPSEPEAPVDEALKIKLPESKTLKRGMEDDVVVLLRKRLKIDTPENSNGRYFDDKVEAAVKSFQSENDLKDNGQLNSKTRAALNNQAEPKKADPKRDINQIIVNMERWRWLPTDLGSFYVMNNIPEFMSRVVKNDNEVLKQKIIVGQPTWPTPVLSASMEFVIFHPEWGVPDGIKVKELLPRLKRASAQYGGGFFDQLFGGGSGGGARVLEAYKLTPTLNGRPVNANNVDWNAVDIRQFSFVQPAGGENPLGLVKFRFPNRHDVYMHDTPQKGLFAQSFRALSHGCMRLDQPRRLAEVILEEDKGWSSDKVGGMMSSGGEVTLSKPVPVYLTYFTVRAEADGKLSKFGDIYGHDDRMVEALKGHFVRYNAPEGGDVANVSNAADSDAVLPPSNKSKATKKTANKKKSTETVGDVMTNALTGLLAN